MSDGRIEKINLTEGNTVLDSLVSTEYRAKYDAAAKELLVEKYSTAILRHTSL